MTKITKIKNFFWWSTR